MALMSFMMCFGSFVQNAKHQVTIKSKRTVEAVKFMADIFQRGETDEIFGWDAGRATTTSSTPARAR